MTEVTPDQLCPTCGHPERHHYADGHGNVFCRSTTDCECRHREEDLNSSTGNQRSPLPAGERKGADRPATLTSNLVTRLRQRLVTVPKPGAKPFKPTYPIVHTYTAGTVHKAGDSAGYVTFNPTIGACAAGYDPNAVMAIEYIFAVDPLCEEAAQTLEAAGYGHETTDDARDAERYRQLRKGNDYRQEGPMVVLCEEEHVKSDDRPFWVLSEAGLDEAVDEARGASSEKATADAP